MESTAVTATNTTRSRAVEAVAEVWPAGSAAVGLVCPFVGLVVVFYIIGIALDSKRP
jgi:hypothetical protein